MGSTRTRATASNRPAAGYGTTIVIGPVGYVCPPAIPETVGSAGRKAQKISAGKFHSRSLPFAPTSFDHLVGTGNQCGRHVEAERPRGCQIDREIEFCRLLDRELAGFRPLQYLIDVNSLYILRFDETRAEWHLTMFKRARAEGI
jgi:hypothetical protein